jgi:hypothetical protein
VKKKSTRISLDLLQINWPAHEEAFRPVVVAFEQSGTLPPEARAELVEQVAFAVFQAFCSVMAKKFVPPPSELAVKAYRIACWAQRLREGPPEGIKNAQLAARLLDLETTAEKVALEQQQRLRPRHSRNVGKQPLEALLHALFDIYAETRSQHPGTGPDIGLNARLVKFIHAVLKAANVLKAADDNPGPDRHLRETVRGALRRWRSLR